MWAIIRSRILVIFFKIGDDDVLHCYSHFCAHGLLNGHSL